MRFPRCTIQLILILQCIPLFVCCEKQEEITEGIVSEEIREVADKYKEMEREGRISLSFLFFTDPHLLDIEPYSRIILQDRLANSFPTAKEIYNYLHLSFCLSGGDWLVSGDSQSLAKEKLLLTDMYLKETFPCYYKMMGNHDTNYQGYVSGEDNSRGDLDREWVNKVYFSETGSAYYSFQSHQTTFYILDSDLDWNVEMDDYKWSQIKWLANSLTEEENEHVVIGIHMFYCSDQIVPMSEEIVKISEAYNNRNILNVEDKEYDFSNAQGKIHFILSGHEHKDAIDYVGSNIPVIRTVNYVRDGQYNFDICILDYTTGYLSMIRVGNGTNRTVKIPV